MGFSQMGLRVESSTSREGTLNFVAYPKFWICWTISSLQKKEKESHKLYYKMTMGAKTRDQCRRTITTKQEKTQKKKNYKMRLCDKSSQPLA